MKILNVNVMLDPVAGGGMTERTFQMSRFLAKAGAECTVLTLDLGLTSERVKDLGKVNVIALPCLLKRYFIPAVSLNKIYDIVKEADIIHLMGHWSILNGLVYLCARRLGKPYVVCPAGALPVQGRSKIFKWIYNILIGNKIIKNADGLIAITRAEISSFESYGINPDNISIIPNGINIEDYAAGDSGNFRSKHGLGEHPFILFVGRLHSIKGPDLLISAFGRTKRSLPDYRLVFAGPDDGMLLKLKSMAVEAGVQDRVHFLGYLQNKDKTRALHCAELLVIPSRAEAMSIVVLEAGAAGKAVLLTDQCGFDEIKAINGGLVVEASVEGLQKGLIRMLNDRAGLKLMAKNLKQFIIERYSWENIISNYVDLYGKIIQKRKENNADG